MSNNSKSLGLKTKALKQRLVYSYLSLAVVGLGLLLVGLIANLWLRTYALEVIEISAPKIELLESMNIGLQSSRAHLHGWISEKNPHHPIARKVAWNDQIYPSLQTLKNIKNNNATQTKQLNLLEEDLKSLEMWQWHIEDIAQTPGNIPSKFIYNSQIKPLILEMLTSSSVLINLQSQNDSSSQLNHLIQFRAALYLSENHLQNYIAEGNSYSKHAFSAEIKKAEHRQQQLSKQKNKYAVNQLEQLTILNNAFSAYQYFSAKAFKARESKDWNVAIFWLEQTMLPLSKKAESHLNIILNKEKQHLKKNAKTILWLGHTVPIIMLALMLVMIITAFYLAKMSIRKFIGPITLLEKQDQLKGDLALLTSKMVETSTLNQLCESIVDSISSTMHVSAAILFIEKNNELHLVAGYARPKNKPLDLTPIKPGEGIIGQVYASNKTITLKTNTVENFTIQSSLIEIKPDTIIVSPITYENKVIAVLELASLSAFTKYQIDFLQSSLKEIGISLNVTRQKEIILQQLTSAQMQAEELQSQQHQLSVSNETLEKQKQKLSTTNEALQQKSEALKNQSIALEKSNTNLSKKSASLQSQTLVLKKTQAETEEKAKQLEASGKYKSEFLANMSHELRTPLNSLLILAKMLAENDEENLTPDQIESASVIHDSGSHLLHLINDILDLSKIEAGRMEITEEIVNIADLAHSLSIRFEHMAKDKGIEFLVKDPANSSKSIVSDGLKIEQILTNLIGNSIKFTHKGQVTLRFNINEDNRLAIAVEDTGIGIDEEKQAAIFEAFQQEDGSTSRTFGGTGLGLSISLAYARLLGGEIQLVSTKNQGSIFTLLLPLHLASENCPSNEQLSNQIVTPIIQKKPSSHIEEQWQASAPPYTDDRDNLEKGLPLILIVEDDTQFSRILFKEAKTQGYQCLVSSDAENGLLLLRQYQVSGILLDLYLTGMNGQEFISRIHVDDKTRHIPVHIISALDNSGNEVKQGAVGYFTKPVSKAQIDEALMRLAHFCSNKKRKILLIEDDLNSRLSINKLLDSEQIEITGVELAAQATEALKSTTFDSIILDLGLPDKNGLDWLEDMQKQQDIVMPPIIIYSGKELSSQEEARLRVYTDSIIFKSAHSAKRLLDEVSLFLHTLKSSSATEKPTDASSSNAIEAHNLKEKRVLVVDDDMRNTFALSQALRNKGMIVEMAGGGQQALEKLQRLEAFDIVLMDIMMPDMDGYETIRTIRKQASFHDLSIIAVTAKAMKGDKEKCLAAGANEYLSKPIDMNKLQTAISTWL